jgi:hypothetical protein
VTEAKSSKKKWRVGWSPDGRKFYFHTPTGYRETLSGRKEGIKNHLRKVLPSYLEIARKGEDAEFTAAIERELAELGAGALA